MNSRSIPKEGAKVTTVLPKSQVTPKDSQKKYNPLRAGNSCWYPNYKWGAIHISVWPYSEAPNWRLEVPLYARISNLCVLANQKVSPKFSGHKWDKKAITISERGRINNQWASLKTKFLSVDWKGTAWNVTFCPMEKKKNKLVMSLMSFIQGETIYRSGELHASWAAKHSTWGIWGKDRVLLSVRRGNTETG